MSADDDAILAAAREGFLEEAQDNLRQFEDALLVMESEPDNAENLNAAFRAAHTIKGGAGLFGFDAVVAFTHEAETLLDVMRAGSLRPDDALMALLLESRDLIARLLDEVRSGGSDPDTAAWSARLGAALRAAAGGRATQATAPAPAPSEAPPADEAVWHLSLRFGPDALRNGLDPLSFIRYLDRVGHVLALETVTDGVPALADLDPEGCHLGFEIRLRTGADRAAIEQVFEFVVDDCDVQILAPDAGDDEREALRALRSQTSEGAALMERMLPKDRPVEALATAPQATRELIELQPAAPAPERRGNGPDRRQNPRRAEDARFIRVRADKLDHLIDIIGELVIASSGAQLAAQGENTAGFLEAALRVASLVEDARDRTLGLRMVPIGETFARFTRVVRDVSKSLGKSVELEVTGGDTELDKAMVDTIADPLMHLVRNSLDHGLELPADRVAAGKPATGRLALNAYQESGQIVIEVSDDGRGLNRARILAKAIERGLVAPDVELSDAEVHELILQPGFSTAEAITDISGRGVGMDVVKRNIEALRGQMHIASTEGRGTTTQIRLPLTLAIIDGFLTTVGGIHCVVPLESVVECIESPESCSAATDGTSGWFDLRGEVLPYVDLRRSFRLKGDAPARQSMMIVRVDRQKVGLLVDRLLGQQQTVIKPLGAVFAQAKGIAGSSILGSGEVALVLDVAALMSDIARARTDRARPGP
jgi:two-component system chemotaxis sensor kinase CheA